MVVHMAQLAHLTLSQEEQLEFTQQLADVLHYMERLKEVERTEDCTPERLPQKEHLREDGVEGIYFRESLLGQAPKKENHYIYIPKISNV